MKTYKQYKKELLKDPDVKAVYDSLEPSYKIANAFIEARLEKNMTQEELATEAGVTQNTITRLESGTTNPTLGTASRIAKALGKELELVAK